MTPIPHFAQVDYRVWRGARPDAEQAAWLVSQGVRTVINLEWEQSDVGVWPEHDGVSSVNLIRIRDFEPLPWFSPSLADRHVIRVLRAIRDGPIVTYVHNRAGSNSIGYVHCFSGQNRTGVAIAAYRLVELMQPVEDVVADFRSFRGWWIRWDERYIREIAARQQWFRDQVAAG